MRGSKPTGTTNKQALQKIKVFDLRTIKNGLNSAHVIFFINIRKMVTMMMNKVKHYVKYSVNECINS